MMGMSVPWATTGQYVPSGWHLSWLAGPAWPCGLLFPIWPNIDVIPARAALGAHDLASKPPDLNVVGILRHVDQPLVPTRIPNTIGDKLHPKSAHVAEGHRRSNRVDACWR